MTRNRDGSGASFSKSNKGMDATGHESKRPRLTMPMQVPGKYEYKVPHPQSFRDAGPHPEFVQALNEVLDMNLTKDHLQLLKPINQLVPLHDALHGEIPDEDFNLTYFDLKSESIVDIKIFKDSLNRLPKVMKNLLGEKNYTCLLDTCNFYYYSALIKHDIGELPDPDMREAFKGLYDENCGVGSHDLDRIKED